MKIINSRIFKILVALFILGITIGIITFIVGSKNNDKIINYFSLINNGEYNYINRFLYSLFNNYKYAFIIWIFGIIIIFSFIIPIIIIYRGVSIGFVLISIFYCFNIKGVFIALILLFPCIIINEFIYLLLSYYSIKFSIKCFSAFKNDSLINIKSFCKNYFYVFIILLFILLLSSLFEVFISSHLLKFVI